MRTTREKWEGRKAFSERMFSQAANGNRAAYDFLFTLFEAVSIADDIHDADVIADENAMSRLCLLFGILPSNPFYRAHGEALSALMTTSALMWGISNTNENAKYYSRNIDQVVFYVALVCGGEHAARELVMQWIEEPKE